MVITMLVDILATNDVKPSTKYGAGYKTEFVLSLGNQWFYPYPLGLIHWHWSKIGLDQLNLPMGKWNYDELNKEGNFVGVSRPLSENFSFEHLNMGRL